MLVVKAIKFNYEPLQNILKLLETFKEMVNEAIQVGLEKRITSRFRLIKAVYTDFKRYGLHTHYTLNACEVACSILKNHRRHKRRKPCIKRLMLKLDNQTYRLEREILRIPTKPREFIEIPLRFRDYHEKFFKDESLKRGSVTLTASTVSVSFSKETEVMEPLGVLGIDLNERSVDIATQQDCFVNKIDVKTIPSIQHEYRVKRAHIQKKNSHNLRKAKELLAKFKERQRRRIEAILHKVSKEIVEYAKGHRLAIALEHLKGFRNSCKKGNGQGKALRGRLNSWNYSKLQRFIEYKASWEGVRVVYIKPKGTSTTYSRCGCSSLELKPKERVVRCTLCGLIMDRDANASLNIAKRGWVLLFQHDSQTDEAMKQSKDVEPRFGSKLIHA